MKNVYIQITKQIFLGLYRVIFISLIGILTGTVIAGNYASDVTGINWQYAGSYGYEAGAKLGAHIGIAIGILISIYLAFRKKPSRNKYSKILHIMLQIFVGFFRIVFLSLIGGFIGEMISRKFAIEILYGNLYGSQAAYVMGTHVGLIFGILLSLYVAMNKIKK